MYELVSKYKQHALSYYFLEDLDFINNTIKELVSRGRLAKSFRLIELTDADLQNARNIAETYQNDFIKRNKDFNGGAQNIENTLAGMYLKKKFPRRLQKGISKKSFSISQLLKT